MYYNYIIADLRVIFQDKLLICNFLKDDFYIKKPFNVRKNNIHIFELFEEKHVLTF